MNLRLLSICGSACGITYNLTRKPSPQYNAVLWGLVFVSVNVYHLYYLYMERTENLTFNGDEMALYTCHFQEWGVEPWQFKKLVKLDGCRFCKFSKGDLVVKDGKPLNDVLMVVKGEVGAEDPKHSSLMYSYRGDGNNGCVIGGTALVDPTIRGRSYPNRLVALQNDTVVCKWNTDKLSLIMQSDKDIESAMLHALYVELIQGLRRDRETKKESIQQFSNSLLELEQMVTKAIKEARVDRDGTQVLKPDSKKRIREFSMENHITYNQKENILRRLGWSMDDWDDGGKIVKGEDVL